MLHTCWHAYLFVCLFVRVLGCVDGELNLRPWHAFCSLGLMHDGVGEVGETLSAIIISKRSKQNKSCVNISLAHHGPPFDFDKQDSIAL